MDNINDITDDLLSLPGFLRRNLLLIRDLDLKSSSLFNEANKLSQSVFGTDHDLDHKAQSSIDKLSTVSAPSNASFSSNKQENATPGKHGLASKKDESPDHKSKSTKNKNEDKPEKGERNTSSKPASNKRRNSRDSISSDDSENLFFEHTKQFDEIQNLRMQGIYVLQEKIDVNAQITSMLKYEYENLKAKFDAIYAEMDLKRQIPHELKMYMASNKKRFQPLTSMEDHEGDGAKKVEERSIAHNQLDIATMFRNVVNNQNALKTQDSMESKEEQTEGKEGFVEQGSKLVNRQVPEAQP